MHCNNCGKQIDKDSEFCQFCGTKVKVIGKEDEEENTEKHIEHIIPHPVEAKKSSSLGKIVTVLVILAFVVFGIYGSVDKEPITTKMRTVSILKIFKLIMLWRYSIWT